MTEALKIVSKAPTKPTILNALLSGLIATPCVVVILLASALLFLVLWPVMPILMYLLKMQEYHDSVTDKLKNQIAKINEN
jgi:ABC-type transport system involved in cytochrome bd biosynthesis fused ATPase/permease subunit